MAPTLRDGQWVLINKCAYLFHAPGRGDVVCIWTGRELLDKRIIGLPGEEVAFQKGKLYVNGTLVFEPYVQGVGNLEVVPSRIPADAFCVIGDNRSGTSVAVVNRLRVVGKVVCCVP